MLRIRKIAEPDKERVKEFFKSLGNEATLFFNANRRNERQLNKFFSGKTEYFIPFMAEYNGEMAGLMFLYRFNRSIPHLGICVKDEYQGKGIGKKLMAYADKYAREHQKGGILLTTHIANIKAQHLYLKSGYEQIGTDNHEIIFLLSF